MKYLIALLSLTVLSTVSQAATKKFEYLTVDYTVQANFTQTLTTLGGNGWELTSCVTSGSSEYTAQSSNGVMTNFLLARTSYCIFKRELAQ